MSWARDEWKLDLPTAALQKISELENDAENLRKSKQQQQFQLESASSTLQKQKQLTAEEKTLNLDLRREIQELTQRCCELEIKDEKAQVDLKAKDSKICLLEEQLRKTREKLKQEEDKNFELIKRFDEQQVDVEAKKNELEQLQKKLEKESGAKEQIAKELDGKFELIYISYRNIALLKKKDRKGNDKYAAVCGLILGVATPTTGTVFKSSKDIFRRCVMSFTSGCFLVPILKGWPVFYPPAGN